MCDFDVPKVLGPFLVSYRRKKLLHLLVFENVSNGFDWAGRERRKALFEGNVQVFQILAMG